VDNKFPYCSLWSECVPSLYRLLDNLKMPGRTSGFHICDILDLNDATAEGKPSAGGEGVPEPPHQLHHAGTYYRSRIQAYIHTSPPSDGRSVGIVRLLTTVTEFSLVVSLDCIQT
jgi:hypothetical protein